MRNSIIKYDKSVWGNIIQFLKALMIKTATKCGRSLWWKISIEKCGIKYNMAFWFCYIYIHTHTKIMEENPFLRSAFVTAMLLWNNLLKSMKWENNIIFLCLVKQRFCYRVYHTWFYIMRNLKLWSTFWVIKKKKIIFFGLISVLSIFYCGLIFHNQWYMHGIK